MNTISAQERKRRIRERRRLSKLTNAASTIASSEVNSSETTTSQEGKPYNSGTHANDHGHCDVSGSLHDSGESSNHASNHDIICESKIQNYDSISGNSNMPESDGHTTKKPRVVMNDQLENDTDNSHFSLGNFALGSSQFSASCSNLPSRDGFSLRPESSRKKLFSDESVCEKMIEPKRNSLFSAVMSRASLSPKQSADPPMSTINEQLDATISSDYNGDSSRSNLPATYGSPKKKIMLSKINSPLRSPGGHGIIKALEAVSDFNRSWYYEENIKDDDILDGEDTNFDEQSKADNGRDHTEDWNIADIEFKISRLMSTYHANDLERNTLQSRKCKQNSSLGQLNAENDSPKTPAKNSLNRIGIIEETNAAFEDSTSISTIKRTYQQPMEMGVLDWTLKKRAKLEFFPGRCMPGVLPSCLGGSSSQQESMPDEGLIHQLAIKYLSRGETTDEDFHSFGRIPSIEESAMAKWLAGTMYYQHPAVHPFPLALFQEESSFSNASKNRSSFSLQNSELNNPHQTQTRKNAIWPPNQLLSQIRGPRSILHRVRLPGYGSMGGSGSSIRPASTNESSRCAQKSEATSSKREHVAVTTDSDLLTQRRREWQEAFRSMYNSWRSNLKCLEAQLSFDDPSINSSPGKLSRCSFYSILSDQVILFRGGLATNIENEDGFGKECKNYVEPVIVFSSTTLDFRSKLRNMGVKLRLFTHKGHSNKTLYNDNEFSESLLQSEFEIEADGADTEVDAELKSLRQVSTHGVGAEVSVSAKKLPKHNGRHHVAFKRNSLPLFVSGDDDCLSVYEILLNTCGNSVSSQTHLSDVPLLVCRSIGPCMHTSLRSLSISACRGDAFHNQSETHRENGKNPEHNEITAVVELRGPLMPCAVRDLMCASVNWLLLDKERQNDDDEGCKMRKRVDGESAYQKSCNEGVIGSHHVAMFVQPHFSDCSAMSPNTTGSSHSCFFNGSDLTLVPDQSRTTYMGSTAAWHECISRECLNIIVWDILRTSTLAYKTSFVS